MVPSVAMLYWVERGTLYTNRVLSPIEITGRDGVLASAAVIDHLVEAIRKVASTDGLSVLLVEQRIDIALELSNRCLVMERGRFRRDAHREQRLAEMVGLLRHFGLARPPVLDALKGNR